MSTRQIVTEDGLELETLLEEAQRPTGVIVLCHPHPEHGGTMRAPILGTIAARALEHELDVLRFNFRGIGSSEGHHGRGQAELLDVDAAVSSLDGHRVPVVGIAGWSFGAVLALRWQEHARSELPYVGIAPPVDSMLTPPLPEPASLLPAPRTFIIGDRDQFVDPNELEAYGATIGAETIRYATADHFFVMRHDRLAADVVDALLEARSSAGNESVG